MSAHETAVGYSPTAVAQTGEQDLIHELRVGSVEAFNYLIAVYHQPLYQFVFRMLGDPADTADTLQEIFLKVFRAAAQFEGKSSLKTWLYRIAVHEACNHRRWWRRHKRQELSLDEEDDDGLCLADQLEDGRDSPLHLALRAEMREQVQRALDAVSEPFHTVLLLREVEGFSYEEMADILQVRVGTVKSRLMRGREMLRRQLMADGVVRRALGMREEDVL